MALSIGDVAPDFEAETTQGPIRFHDWVGDAWAVLFSHPKDFTPVCTTELGYMARIKPEFDKRGVKIIGLSVDPLTSHPDVLEVAVFGVPHKIYGETVAAVVVPRGSASPTPDELAGFCRERLAPFEVPTSFQEARELPHTAKGSLDRRAVAQQFGPAA